MIRSQHAFACGAGRCSAMSGECCGRAGCSSVPRGIPVTLYGAGIAHGDDIFEHGGFAVHFFPRGLIGALADGSGGS